jgi:hypothetical protein
MFRSQKAWEVEDQCAELKRNAWAMRRQSSEDRQKLRDINAALARFENDAKQKRDEMRRLQGLVHSPCVGGDVLDRWAGRGRILLPGRLPPAGRHLEAACETNRQAAQQELLRLNDELRLLERVIAEREAERRAIDERTRRQMEDWDRGVQEFRRLGCTGNL